MFGLNKKTKIALLLAALACIFLVTCYIWYKSSAFPDISDRVAIQSDFAEEFRNGTAYFKESKIPTLYDKVQKDSASAEERIKKLKDLDLLEHECRKQFEAYVRKLPTFRDIKFEGNKIDIIFQDNSYLTLSGWCEKD